jgi:hypothetical protein
LEAETFDVEREQGRLVAAVMHISHAYVWNLAFSYEKSPNNGKKSGNAYHAILNSCKIHISSCDAP